ncbi:DUF431-domain-containing protein [Amylocystis lapponica]|nr:DUF431-domain-containing protein [Amylocystis lapponica]
MVFTYVIEHMEEDEDTSKALPKWVELEYMHMRTLAGPSSQVHFTHLSQSSCTTLSSLFADAPTDTPLAPATPQQESIQQLMEHAGVSLAQICLLDPKADAPLAPEDGDGRFAWFLFGVRDDPPRDRTAELRALGFPGRHLGPVQMTTDTALGVTKLVVQDGSACARTSWLRPSDYPTIVFNARESVEMPFRYIADGKEPKLPPGMRQHLHEDLDKSFDF